jgi:hypothetical protein
VIRLTSLIRSPFSFLFTRSTAEARVTDYVIREHRHGRSLADILRDNYVQNRLTPEQQNRLLDRPELIEAIGHDVVSGARAANASRS